MVALAFHNFVSAATGIAIAAAFVRAKWPHTPAAGVIVRLLTSTPARQPR